MCQPCENIEIIGGCGNENRVGPSGRVWAPQWARGREGGSFPENELQNKTLLPLAVLQERKRAYSTVQHTKKYINRIKNFKNYYLMFSSQLQSSSILFDIIGSCIS